MLKNSEDAFDEAAEEAKATWTQVLCGKISFANLAKKCGKALISLQVTKIQ